MQGSSLPNASLFLSPYHLPLSHEAEEEAAHMRALEEQLVLSGGAPLPREAVGGLPFHYVAKALEQGRKENRAGRINMVAGLVHEALEAAHASSTNPTLQVLALLRVLLPSRDSRSVYGFKTTSLVRSFAKAIEKDGGVSGKAAAQELLRAIRTPHPDEDGHNHLVTLPEVAIARAHARCFLSATAGQQPLTPLSLVEVAALCQKLTNIYKERHKQAVLTLTGRLGGRGAMSVHIDSVAEVLGTVLTRLSYEECMVLVRLLLRTVPMGIGPKTVMEALGPHLGAFLDVQQDLGRLAMAIVKQREQPTTTATTIMPGLVCGVPMTPMTCHTTSSPYLMKWLFTKQDTIQQYLPPKAGQLIIHSSGVWYVPLKSSGPITGRHRFVDLESPEAISIAHRKKHMLLMREIKRYSPALIRPDKVRGYMISYMLYLDNNKQQQSGGGSYVMLLQGAEPLLASNSKNTIEFVDASVVLDDPKQYDEQDGGATKHGDGEKEDPDYQPSTSKANQEAKKKERDHQKQETKKRIQDILEGMLSDTARQSAAQTPRGMVRISLMMTPDADQPSSNRKLMGGGMGSSSSVLLKKEEGILAQRKMDGDRMQAHIMQDSKGNVVVKLFTKRGRPVHMLYTDVANELKQLILSKDQPCILDGEIVVVDSDTHKPLPWSSTKWRYDSGCGRTLEELTPTEKKCALTLVDGASAYAYNPDDEEDTLTFAPSANALAQWSDLGASERRRLKVKALPKAKLMFVVFDILMHHGVPLSGKTCRQRWELLQTMPSLKRKSMMKHVSVLSEAWYVRNAEELLEKLAYIVKEKGEGLILKNPDAPYEFTRSMHQRKLKICGPDINCGVVGLGFTLSRNPHQWGLLTCIHSGATQQLLVYNRVEVLEGDRIKMAAEHILGLPSLVSLHEVLHHSSQAKPIQCGPFQVFVTYHDDHTQPQKHRHQSSSSSKRHLFSVTWLVTQGSERHTLYFMQGVPKDIQWLCSPFDCRFGLSQRGDVYPVDWRGEAAEEEAATGGPTVVMQVPRFPVGRIQLDDHQRSEFDTPTSIAEKFEAASEEGTCIQGYITRKLKQLRTKPPQPRKLEEIRRILTAMQDPKETWPKMCPTTFYLSAFSDMLRRQGLEELTPAERMVLSGIPKASQWDLLLIQQIPLKQISSQETTLMGAHYEAEKERLSHRLWEFKRKAQRTYLLASSSSSFTRTSENFMERILDTEVTSSSTMMNDDAHTGSGTVSMMNKPAGKESECFTTLPACDSGGGWSPQASEEEKEEDESEEDEIMDSEAAAYSSFCMDPNDGGQMEAPLEFEEDGYEVDTSALYDNIGSPPHHYYYADYDHPPYYMDEYGDTRAEHAHSNNIHPHAFTLEDDNDKGMLPYEAMYLHE